MNIDPLNNRLTSVQSSFQAFFEIAAQGDVISAYRGRVIWANKGPEEITRPVEMLMDEAPSARSAVLHFISNLVHENVNHYFSEKERKDAMGRVDCKNLESALQTLIKKLCDMRQSLGSKTSFSLMLLNWLFELFSDLCRYNHNRPFFNHQRPPHHVLIKTFQQINCVAQLFTLLETTFISMLNIAPEKAIHAFITAHKTYSYFDWITAYITDSFPPNIIDILVKIGADEFQAFCNEVNKPNAKRVIQLQEEYAARLHLFSDIFQYMGRNRMIELRRCFLTIIENFIENGENLTDFIFLVKLALTTPDIFLPFTDEIIQIVMCPQSVDRFATLNQTPSFRVAVSYTNQMHSFVAKLLERADTGSVFALIRFLTPLMYGNGNGMLHWDGTH